MLFRKVLALAVSIMALPVIPCVQAENETELFYGTYDMSEVNPDAENGVMFEQEVPDGDYTVTVTTGGDTETNANIYINGGERVRVYTLEAGEVQENAQPVVPLDGKITVQVKGTNPNVTEIEIEQLPNRSQKGEKPTIYIAGDSTAPTYDHTKVYPQTGWGQVFAEYFTDDIIIENRSMGGRSLKSYNNDGRLDRILTEIHPGDYVFIQFGINDGAVNKPERYISVEDYKVLLTEKYIGEIRKRGGIPVLLTATAAAWYDEEKGEFMESRQDYAVPTKEVAEETGAILLDVNAYMTAGWNILANLNREEKVFYCYFICEPLESKAYPMGTDDHTHLKELGAETVAMLVANITSENIAELKEYLKEEEEFTDISGHWGEDTIIIAKNIGVVDGVGDGKFEPDRSVTRAEYLKMIMEMCGISGHAYRDGECLDATNNDWYCYYLQSALDKDLIPEAMIEDCKKEAVTKVLAEATEEKEAVTIDINVYSGKFKGDVEITREEMAALTMNCVSYQLKNDIEHDGLYERDDESTLIDIYDVSPEYKNAVEAAFNNNIVDGDDDYMFYPKSTLTRVEAATVMLNIRGSMELKSTEKLLGETGFGTGR